jgi:hypothetical protein
MAVMITIGFALIAFLVLAHYIADKRGQSRLMGESYGAQDANRCAIFRELAFFVIWA